MEQNPSTSTRNGFSEKWKNLKHKEIILVAVIVVILLFLWFFSLNPTAQTTGTTDFSDLTGRERLYCEIKDAIGGISGDYDSKVVISWKENESVNETTSFFGDSTKNESTTIDGIAIICQNGGKAEIKVPITMMLSSLLGLSPDRIGVYEKK